VVGDFQFGSNKGLCPYCGGSHFRGASPNLMEIIKLYFNYYLWREKTKWKRN